MENTLVVLKNGSTISQSVDEVGIDGDFVALSREGKTVALFRATDVKAVIDSVEQDGAPVFAFSIIAGDEAMQGWVDSVQEQILTSKQTADH